MSDDSKQQKKPVFKVHKRLANKKWLIVGAVAILLFTGVFGGWLFVYNQNKPLSNSSTEDATLSESRLQQNEKREKIVIGITNEATNILANEGSVSDAAALYEDAIKLETDDITKKYLLLGEATMYFNELDYDTALSVAISAESILESSGLAAFIAQVYENKGDKLNAIKYYQKAVSLIDSSTNPLADSDVEYYNYKAKELNE